MTDELRIEIDPLILDKEFAGHPEQYHRWAVLLADARDATRRAKSEVDLTRAEMDKAIRRDPAAYGVAKVTEGVVAAAILTTPEYKAALAEYHEAYHNQDVMQAAVEALEHRKTALSKAVDLWIKDYFSAPTTPKGDEAREVIEAEERRNTRGRGRKRRKRRDESSDE